MRLYDIEMTLVLKIHLWFGGFVNKKNQQHTYNQHAYKMRTHAYVQKYIYIYGLEIAFKKLNGYNYQLNTRPHKT